MEGADCLADLPPSAKLVYKVLEYDGPLTQKTLAEESLLAPRTVRSALKRLEDCDLVEERVYSADARQRLYGALGDGEASNERGMDAEQADGAPTEADDDETTAETAESDAASTGSDARSGPT